MSRATPSRLDLAKQAIERASDHLEAARLLMAGARYDFASFHLLTAMEEWVKSKVLHAAHHGTFKGVKFNGRPVMANLDRFLFDHNPKLVSAMLGLVIQSRLMLLFDADGKVRRSDPAEAERVRREANAEVLWLVRLFTDHPRLREEAIYSGPDKKGKMPDPVDWTEFATRVTPALEILIPFGRWRLDQPVSQQDKENIRNAYLAWAKIAEAA